MISHVLSEGGGPGLWPAVVPIALSVLVSAPDLVPAAEPALLAFPGCECVAATRFEPRAHLGLRLLCVPDTRAPAPAGRNPPRGRGERGGMEQRGAGHESGAISR